MRGWCGYTATYLGPVRPGHQRKTCPCDQPQHACQHRNEVEADHGRSDLLLGGFRGRCLGLHDLERGFLCRAELQACSLGVVRLSQKVTAENGIGVCTRPVGWRICASVMERAKSAATCLTLLTADCGWPHGFGAYSSSGRLLLVGLRAASSSAPVVVTRPGILRRYGVLLVSSEG